MDKALNIALCVLIGIILVLWIAPDMNVATNEVAEENEVHQFEIQVVTWGGYANRQLINGGQDNSSLVKEFKNWKVQ